MRNYLKICAILLFIPFTETIAQSDFRDGYIVSTHNDTIYGKIDYRSNAKNYESCLFMKNDIITEYSPTQIVGYGFVNDKFFSSAIVEKLFVEVLVYGKISLFRLKYNFFVRKNEGEIIELESNQNEVSIDGKQGIVENNRWRGIISYFISDCLSNSNQITKILELNEKSLTKLITRYNKCTGIDFTVFKENKPWTKFEVGASVGLSSTFIKINNDRAQYDYLGDAYNSTDPNLGIIVAISSPRIAEKLVVQGEIHIVNSSYSALVELNKSYQTEFHDTYIDLTTISVPVSVKYSFPEKKYSFYTQAGINYNFNIKTETKLLTETVSNNIVNTSPETIAFVINNTQIGYWGGIGLLKTFHHFKGSVNLRYFKMTSLNKTGEFTANNNRITLSIIISKK